MAFLTSAEEEQITKKLTTDLSFLGKLYNAKKSDYETKNVEHSLVESYKEDGWEEYGKPLKHKTRLRRTKPYDIIFEDKVWCQFYELGFRHMNYDRLCRIKYGKDDSDWKQIDIVAIKDDMVFLVECKSSERPKIAPSYKTEFGGLSLMIDGFKKSIHHIFGRESKLKYVFALHNLLKDIESEDIQRLLSTNSFFYNDNTYRYINSLIKTYKGAATYQFLGLMFKDQQISSTRIEIPAIEGRMGHKRMKYYMFSIEPKILLKLGFVLHRIKANEAEMPTYQRLLVPGRLNDIRKFINNGGYFPNSVIINFSQNKNKIEFQGNAKSNDTESKLGILKIPNAYAIAYIIDGQHRIYGYTDTNHDSNNTIPVVAFVDLASEDQLRIFMEINENQKKINASLRLTLDRDIHWNSDRIDSRLKALRSSIVINLCETTNGPLDDRIEIGEDKRLLKFTPFSTGLSDSGLLPKANASKYDQNTIQGSIYNVLNQKHDSEMERVRRLIVKLLNLCYELVRTEFPDIFNMDRSFILSNRGTYAFIGLIGSLNKFETVVNNNLNLNSSADERFEYISKYLRGFLISLTTISEEDKSALYKNYGSGSYLYWLRSFQMLVNEQFSEFEPVELLDWKERFDQSIQLEGRTLGVEIEKYLKKSVLDNLKSLFKENWELEIGSIKRKCSELADAEMEKFYKEFKKKKVIHWTEMFQIVDYKTIIEKYWTRKIEDNLDFHSFSELFALDFGFQGKGKDTKWISLFNSYRTLWAHEGSKEKGLNREELKFLKEVHLKLGLHN